MFKRFGQKPSFVDGKGTVLEVNHNLHGLQRSGFSNKDKLSLGDRHPGTPEPTPETFKDRREFRSRFGELGSKGGAAFTYKVYRKQFPVTQKQIVDAEITHIARRAKKVKN